MIKQIQTEDWQRLREVRLRALAQAPEVYLETHANASSFTDELWIERATPDDEGCSFAVERDGHFDGLVSCFTAGDPGSVFLVAMWVAPQLRGTGVASELVEHVVNWAREHRAERVCLSVEPENARAARLYEKCGFAETTNPPPFPYDPNPGNRFYVFEL